MAKDTEKLIRQLSLISYLMAERRPVTAPEIRRDVEGYSGMNEDAFARARDHRVGRRPRALAAPGEDRNGDLQAQDDRLRLLHDGARRGRHTQRRPLPAALPGRAVLSRRSCTRPRRRTRLPPLADA